MRYISRYYKGILESRMQGQGLLSQKFNKSYLTLVPQATLQKIIYRALSTKIISKEKQLPFNAFFPSFSLVKNSPNDLQITASK